MASRLTQSELRALIDTLRGFTWLLPGLEACRASSVRAFCGGSAEPGAVPSGYQA